MKVFRLLEIHSSHFNEDGSLEWHSKVIWLQLLAMFVLLFVLSLGLGVGCLITVIIDSWNWGLIFQTMLAFVFFIISQGILYLVVSVYVAWRRYRLDN